MLSSRNGNDLRSQTTIFKIEDVTQIGEARRFAATLCAQMEFDETRKGRVGIVINELASNILKYSSKGLICLRAIDQGSACGLEILAIDWGPGIPDTNDALVDGFTTGSSPGTGLGAVRRLSDVFDIYSRLDLGSVVLSLIYALSEISSKSNFMVGAVSVPIKNEIFNGDDWSLRETNERLEILVVDGLGHGALAHAAAREAVGEFESSPRLGADVILTSVHQRLRSTRGAAVFIAQVNVADHQIQYASAGNIRAVIQSSDSMKTLISQNGTAGVRLSTTKLFHQEWNGPGFLIFHSDGINSRWDASKYPGILNHHPAVIAAVIYRDYNRGSDDATVLVIGKTLR